MANDNEFRMLALQLCGSIVKQASLINIVINGILETLAKEDRLFRDHMRRIREEEEEDRQAERSSHRRKRMLILSHFERQFKTRKMWKRERPQGPVFWENIECNFDDEEWRAHFRMSKSTFNFVCELLEPELRRKETNFRRPLEPRVRLAMALWWYATPCEYRSISVLFGVGISTVCMVVSQVTVALRSTLMKRFIDLPSGARLQETINGFAEKDYPMCAGAIDGTHIPIIAPQEDATSYYNRKGWHSVILQAVVDHECRFTDVYVGWPGRTPDAKVLANSPLYRKAEDADGYLFPHEVSMNVDGVEIPAHLVGDPAYPLRNWLMKGFTDHQDLNQQKSKFNSRLSSALIVVENAFGRLKGRWRRLSKRLHISTAFVSDVVIACCILHNICEINKDHFLPEWNINEEQVLPQPERDPAQGSTARGAQAIRKAIMSSL
ncbi:uncharacterized protein [Narcine bancroftii]|uniref:uncharacterized protein n=1 Tax=Narcine bancroftii TaxID=1343680 RepID=UPI00383200BA